MSGTAGSRPEAGRTATNREMEKEFAFFGEVWTFFKKYYFPRPDASYWSDLVEEDKSTIKLGKNTMSLLRKCALNIGI